jgi:hypothetical protein
MMTNAQMIIEVMSWEVRENYRMRCTAIAGLLLIGAATAALPAGQKIFKAHGSICDAVLGFL